MTIHIHDGQPATTKEEFKTISRIVDRALSNMPNTVRLDLMMDIEFAHADIPIKLEELLSANNGDFFHDISGIRMHLNRDTKKLEDCFVPRYAVRDSGVTA